MVDDFDKNSQRDLEDEIDDSVHTEAEYGKGFVEIEFPYQKTDNVFLPCRNSETKVKFIYKAKSVLDEKEIERKSYIISAREDKIDNSHVCVHFYQRLTVRRCLFAIDNWFVQRKNDWIVKEDWEKIKRMSAPIINTSLTLFDIFTSLREEEEKLIERQAVGLYSSQNGSVSNPHPVLSSFCSLSALWDKLGIGPNDLDVIPNKDYVGFRMITGAEADAMRRATKN